MRVSSGIVILALGLAGGSVVAQDGEHPPDYETKIRLDKSRGATLSAYFDSERTRGMLRIRAAGLDWSSPVYPAWNARVADLDGDGHDEVLIGVWSHAQRHDEPQPHRAVWVLGWRQGALEALWRGSALARPMRDFDAVDLDDDGRAELFSLERVDSTCMVAAYRWTGFGFGGHGTVRVDCEARLDDTTPGCVARGSRQICYELHGDHLHEKP
jgi:hypothetical protein